MVSCNIFYKVSIHIRYDFGYRLIVENLLKEANVNCGIEIVKSLPGLKGFFFIFYLSKEE